MEGVLVLPWARRLGSLWCSREGKARDGANILARSLGLGITELAELGENDRSATGYLAPAEFEAVADLFFAHPQEAVRSWERAADAQGRIVAAVERVLDGSVAGGGDVAIVSHGAVGALLLCHLLACPIGREHDQPPTKGGNYFAFDADTRQICHGWRAIDPQSGPGQSVAPP
jgi:broad specificity phosphatase PhoE